MNINYNSCMVPTCGAKRHDFPNRRFARIPKNPDQYQLWLDAVGRTGRVSKNAVVCSIHFNESDFGKDRIKPYSIPSKNLPPRTTKKIVAPLEISDESVDSQDSVVSAKEVPPPPVVSSSKKAYNYIGLPNLKPHIIFGLKDRFLFTYDIFRELMETLIKHIQSFYLKTITHAIVSAIIRILIVEYKMLGDLPICLEESLWIMVLEKTSEPLRKNENGTVKGFNIPKNLTMPFPSRGTFNAIMKSNKIKLICKAFVLDLFVEVEKYIPFPALEDFQFLTTLLHKHIKLFKGSNYDRSHLSQEFLTQFCIANHLPHRRFVDPTRNKKILVEVTGEILLDDGNYQSSMEKMINEYCETFGETDTNLDELLDLLQLTAFRRRAAYLEMPVLDFLTRYLLLTDKNFLRFDMTLYFNCDLSVLHTDMFCEANLSSLQNMTNNNTMLTSVDLIHSLDRAILLPLVFKELPIGNKWDTTTVNLSRSLEQDRWNYFVSYAGQTLYTTFDVVEALENSIAIICLFNLPIPRHLHVTYTFLLAFLKLKTTQDNVVLHWLKIFENKAKEFARLITI